MAGELAELADRCNFEIPFGKPQFPAYERRTFHTARISPPTGVRRTAAALPRTRGCHAPSSRTGLSIITAVGYEGYFYGMELPSGLPTHASSGSPAAARRIRSCVIASAFRCLPGPLRPLFRRFLNQERMALNKLPDIDVDFPTPQRRRGGFDLCQIHARALRCGGGFSTFQGRSAFADVAKVLAWPNAKCAASPSIFPGASAAAGCRTNIRRARSEVARVARGQPRNRDLPLYESRSRPRSTWRSSSTAFRAIRRCIRAGSCCRASPCTN